MNGKKLGAGLRGLLNCLIPILLAFLVGGIVIAVIGENPLNTYWVLLQKSLFTKVGFQNTLHYAGPMILTGLAIAVTFKANIYNMGVEGSLLLGAFFAGILGSRMTGNPFVVKLVCLAVGVLCGMAYSLVPALLKAKLRADEMVVTLMLNPLPMQAAADVISLLMSLMNPEEELSDSFIMFLFLGDAQKNRQSFKCCFCQCSNAASAKAQT